MPEPVQFARIAEAYSASTSYSRPRSPSGSRLGDTVQISKEAYEKSKEYMMQMEDEPSSNQPSPKLQTGNDPEILNLPPDASRDQIRKAYIGAIKQYHPDNFAGLSPEFARLAEEKSKQINLAYKKLTSS